MGAQPYKGLEPRPASRKRADLLLGIKPSSVVTEIVSEEVISAHDLDQKLEEASTQGIIAEIDTRYDSR